LFGKSGRRSAYVVTTAFLAAVAFAFPALAAAEPTGDGAVIESLAPSHQGHQGPGGRWTQRRLEEAEPLPVVTLPEPAAKAVLGGDAPIPEVTAGPAAPDEATGLPTYSPSAEAARTAALSAASQTAAIEGVEVSAAESNVFPNSANGKLFGTYEVPLPKEEGKPQQYRVEDYSCSAGVIKSPKGNVVLTAGHCLIDPASGVRTNSEMIFIPGYRNGTAPYGTWGVSFFTTTEAWSKTALPGSRPNEGGDVAFVGLAENAEHKSVEKVVGSLEIAFDQACDQIYTQFGYPAEAPYGGELLYSHTTPYAGADTAGGFRPVPMKIASDFTRGASGGPWAVGIGSGSPTVLSLTAYGYESQPGYLYGPYLGEAAKKAYGVAIGKTLASGIEETCAELPAPPPIVPTPPSSTTPPSTEPPKEIVQPPGRQVTLQVTRVRSRANGSAVLTAKVNGAGELALSGAAVRAETLAAPGAGHYRLVVAAKGATNRRLRKVGRAKVGISVAFSASGTTKRVKRKVALSRPAVARAAQKRAARTP
jgi:hypothetical protein